MQTAVEPSAAETPPAQRPFPTPRPNPALTWVVGFVNRWVLLGLPVLRYIPGLRDVPGIRGYLRIRRLDLPYADRARLRRAVNPSTAAFVAPNHPEFGLDWTIDKEISARFAPNMAFWAAHEIIDSQPAFWRANNLIANNGGEAAMEYSVRWALAGNGVLLHPEGAVRWTSDRVQSLFGGVAELAIETARRAARDGIDRPVHIVPVVWKLRYLADVSDALDREMRRIERALSLPLGDGQPLVERFHALQQNVLARRAARFGYTLDPTEERDFFDWQDQFRLWLVNDVASRHVVDQSGPLDRRIFRLERAVRAERRRAREDGDSVGASNRSTELRDDFARVQEALRLGGFTRDVYSTRTLSQEQIAESLKRLRAALLRRGTANVVHNYLPRPYGARVVHVRVPEPIVIDPRRASLDAADRDAYVAELLERTRRALQESLDAINAECGPEVAALSHSNPFLVRRRASRA